MTKRKIQHQLEDLSRYKYGLALPPRWVFRDKSKDYGIDGEVEIFDSKDRATGLVYWVQLKATKSKKESIIRSIDLDIEKIQYYKRLEIPVLLVRYSSEQDLFYIKWVNEVDTFYAKKGAKKMRIKFSDTDRWGDSSALKIERYLTKLRMIKKGAISLPLPFRIAFGDDAICGEPTGVLLVRLRVELKKYGEILKIVSTEEKSLVDVHVDKSTLKIGILDVAGCTFHSVDLMNRSTFVADLLKDIMLGMALSTMQLGFNDLAARIVFSKDITERFQTKLEIVRRMLPGLLKTTYFEEVLELVSNLADNADDNLLELMANAAILFTKNRDDEKKSTAIENFLKRNAERSKAINTGLYGVSLYNLGNFYRSINKSREAARYYLKARRYESNYYSQEYFFGELAGFLFEIEKYKYSAMFYKKAIEFNGEKEWRPQYADALMFSGEYQQALDLFNDYLLETCDHTAEWHLKAICLEGMIDINGTKSQIRNKDAALFLADVGKEPDNVVEEKLKEALSLDLLCGLAWYNLGQTYYKKKDIENTLFCFVACSLVQSWDVEAWVNATLSSFNEKTPTEIFVLVVQAAYFCNKEKYLEALYKHISVQNREDALPHISSAIEQIISKGLDVEGSPELRFLDKDGKFKNIIEIGDA